MERRLAANVASDVVGYSALMERDEAGTHERLKAGRIELFEPEIARHHGRVFKLMGDGMLAEFSSVVDSVECAVCLQRGLTERNSVVPEDQRFDVRIGITLGEVIVEGEDRYGKGVNVASRLQQLAEPGGICVSGKALGVGYVLEGNVRKVAGEMRIVAQLIDTSDGKHVWAERFDESASDPFALQDAVTVKIIAAIAGENGEIRHAEYRRMWGADTVDLEGPKWRCQAIELADRCIIICTAFCARCVNFKVRVGIAAHAIIGSRKNRNTRTCFQTI